MRKPGSGAQPRPLTEEHYFRRRDAELIRELKQREAAREECKRIKQATGIADDQLVAELQASGYDSETVQVLHLVPLLQVAWADGEVSKQEKRHILEAARLHGVEPDSHAYRRLTSWLEHRPTEAFFRKSLRAVRAVLHALEPEQKRARKLSLLSLCTKVASASGGLFGLGSKISPVERALLAEIAAEVEPEHGGAARLLAAEIQRR